LEEYTASTFKAEEKDKQVRSHALVVCFLDSHFDPEDGGNMFLQNIRLSLNYVALQPK
jgi:hypothetical protein